MNVYEVTFQQAVNEDFILHVPTEWEDFQMAAPCIQEAILQLADKLNSYRLMHGGKNEYWLDLVEDSCEFWFGDFETNQDVMFYIQEI